MELKGYQQKNINELDRFLEILGKEKNTKEAFRVFWQTGDVPVTPFPGTVIEPYKNNVKGAPHVCHKVPTGGGKTFLAAAALKVIANRIRLPYQVVIWLVPSNAILEQTLRNLKNKQHPYRQRIDTDFNNRVEVFDKQQALTGHGFTLTAVRENLCILVMSYDSFRTNNKEGRKVYQENGYLQSFAPLVYTNPETEDEVQLMSVLQTVHPIVVVDESHNATSKLSEQMLNELQPSFVLDLTATPRENSNIICFTDALELKRCNMVKLPVIVYNHSKKEQVIDSALHLQRRLEETAKVEVKNGGEYIRPIVLFQAESNISGENRETFEKVKATLLKLNIPEEQIKIKTADINELKDVDLMSRDCPVRYVITVNALKEGWDCPFAYILASLADKSSNVDVEQIVGRVLRLPYARHNENDVLNISYVLTASAKFQETLQNVVKALNHAGFSDRDYRAVDVAESVQQTSTVEVSQTTLFTTTHTEQTTEEINIDEITFNANAGEEVRVEPAVVVNNTVDNIIMHAEEESAKMEEQVNNQNGPVTPPELAPQVKTATIKSTFAESTKVKLPKFYIPNNCGQGCLFGENEDIELKPSHLLENFKLSEQDCKISFAAAEATMYKVDIDTMSDEHTPRYEKVQGKAYNFMLEYIREADSLDKKVKRCAQSVTGIMGKMNPLTAKDILSYVSRIFEEFDDEKLEDFMLHLNEYTQKIKDKILYLEEEYKKELFVRMVDTEEVFLKSTYQIPDKITLKSPMQGIPKMLHTREDEINDFEASVINDVANLDNVEWWTRVVERRDGSFFINGFINHYPDFIIRTKKGKIVLLETKGGHLIAENKILLGNLWASKAGSDYRYCLVYENREVDGAYTRDKFIELLKRL